jgi:hypothetical protein
VREYEVEAFIEANRHNWNERTAVYVRSQAYDLEGFIAGRSGAIPEDEQAEVGAVDGQDLLRGDVPALEVDKAGNPQDQPGGHRHQQLPGVCPLLRGDDLGAGGVEVRP